MSEEPKDGLLEEGGINFIVEYRKYCNFLAKNRYILFHFISEAAEFGLRCKAGCTSWDNHQIQVTQNLLVHLTELNSTEYSWTQTKVINDTSFIARYLQLMS